MLKFTSTIKFTDTQNNIFKNPNTGAIQIDGGLGVDKNALLDLHYMLQPILKLVETLHPPTRLQDH